MWSGDVMCWLGGVGVGVLPGGFSCKVFSRVSPRVYFRKHAFCFLPLVTIFSSFWEVLLELMPSRNLKIKWILLENC
jgi:hypothetical protein